MKRRFQTISFGLKASGVLSAPIWHVLRMCAKRSVTQFCSIFLVIFFRENPPTNSKHTAFPPVHTFFSFGGSQSHHHGAHVTRRDTNVTSSQS